MLARRYVDVGVLRHVGVKIIEQCTLGESPPAIVFIKAIRFRRSVFWQRVN
jgi:hypothetical protein